MRHLGSKLLESLLTTPKLKRLLFSLHILLYIYIYFIFVLLWGSFVHSFTHSRLKLDF